MTSGTTRRIIGTAGHIDHGKTALVRAITGVDCDRLPEEKRRGITIDLGFARWSRDEFQIGFVDVPGHERFVKNMLAGIGGIDSVLLVVAADESIKPQTREHFAICRLLEIPRGVVAITKSDLVDDEILQLVRLEIEDMARGTFLEESPIVPVSSVTKEGLEELEQALIDSVRDSTEREGDTRVFRLPVDRAFTMKGFGSVVTGTMISGRIELDEEVEALPHGGKSRARNIQVHGESRANALAGERTSLNLPDLSLQSLRRGQQIVRPGILQSSSLLTIELHLLDEAPVVKDHARIRFHHYSAERIGSVRILDPDLREIGPGARCFAQIRLEKPVVAVAGDRFVIRRYSPAWTIGGGTIVDPHLSRLPRSTRPAILEELSSPRFATKLGVLARLAGLEGISIASLQSRTGLLAGEIRHRIDQDAPDDVVAIADGTLWIHRSHQLAFRKAAMEFLQTYFEQNRMTLGVPKGEFIQKLVPRTTPPLVLSFLIEDLGGEKIIRLEGDLIEIPGRSKELGGKEGDLARRIEERFREAGLQPPSIPELSRELSQKTKIVEGVAGFLGRSGVLVRIAEGLYLHRDSVAVAAERVRKHQGETVEVAWFKNLFGLSRKFVIPLLEHFDRTGITRRSGDQRLIL